jgi:hypothetical protein
VALEWSELAVQIEAHYPTARGGTGQDARLQLSLTRFANSFFKFMERTRRWSLAYSTGTISTVAGTATYAIPTNITAITHLYYILASGACVELEDYDAMELRAIYGEGANSQQGPPRGFAIEGTNIQLFPVPDSNAGSNYSLIVEGYQTLKPIIETTGTTTAANATLTVPSSAYLTDRGLATSGSYLSVRGAGNLGPNSVAGTFFTNWTAFPLATTVTMSANAVTAVTAGQTFFNSWNWLIDGFDHVVLFGVLREVAAYLKENYTIWEQRLESALMEMTQFDADRRATINSMATVVSGQRMAQLALLDSRIFWGGLPNAAWY